MKTGLVIQLASDQVKIGESINLNAIYRPFPALMDAYKDKQNLTLNCEQDGTSIISRKISFNEEVVEPIKFNKKGISHIKCFVKIGESIKLNEEIASVHVVNIVDAIPQKPNLLSPGSSNSPGSILTSLKPTLSWNAVDNTTYYKVAVRDVNTDNLVVNKTNITSTSLVISNSLTAGHQYYWNITACNDAGCSAWAEPLYFQTKESTDKPSIPDTTGEYITYEAIVIYWDAVDGATKYQLELEDVANGSIKTVEVTVESGGFTNLASEHDYKIRVRAYNSNGYGDFSPYINFKTNKYIPDAPSLIVVEVEGLKAIMAWQEVDGADRYNVEVIDRDGNDNHSKYVDKNKIIVSNLTAGHRYKVKIRARVNGNYGDYSNYEYFEIEDSETVLPPPNKTYYSIVVPNVVLSWDGVTGAEKYGLQIDEIHGNNYDKVKEVSANQITLSNSELKGGRQYRMRVRSYANGQYGNYSSYGSFEICASRWLPNPLTKTLRKKASEDPWKYDSDVEKLQNFLSDLNYSLEVDGLFGDDTYNVVVDYQSNNGLSVDGKVGTNTIQHMRTTCY